MSIMGDAAAYAGGARGCGKRQPGGIYAECGLSENGSPLEDFLLCPPLPVDKDAMGLTPLGTKLVQHSEGTWHLIDWIGANNYPNVADFVEETRRMGASRRLSPLLDYSLLTPGSRMLLLHERAIDLDADGLFALSVVDLENPEAEVPLYRPCPKRLPEHSTEALHKTLGEAICTFGTEAAVPFPMCARFWYEAIEGGHAFPDEAGAGPRDVYREMPSFIYHGRRAPENAKPEYALGMFMWLPVGRIAIVRDAEAGTHEAAFEKVKGTSLPVDLVNE